MSLKYFVRYQFNGLDPAEDDFGKRDFAVEVGALSTVEDTTYGKVLEMDGATSLMSTGTLDDISGVTPRSFSFWAASDLTSSPVLSYGELIPGSAFVIYSNNTLNNPEVYDYTSSYTSPGFTNTVDTWAHYAVTYDGTSLKTYVNGVISSTATVTLATGTSDPFRLGTDGEGNYFNGKLSDIRAYDHEIDPSVVEYIHSSGPNYEEKIDMAYTSSGSTRGFSMSGTHISKSSYGIEAGGNTLTDSYFAHDDSGTIQEASRLEYTENLDGDGETDMKVRHTDTGGNATMFSTIKTSAETTTFNSIDITDTTSSIVFSSDGVTIESAASGENGMFFGASKDFRISVVNSSFQVAAYDNTSGTYLTKMEIS